MTYPRSELSRAVISSPLRTPVGSLGGSLRTLGAEQLAATLIAALLRRSGLDPLQLDDVILGQGYPDGEAPAVGRVAAMRAGLPVEVPGFQLDRRCGSGLQAICTAAMQVQTGVSQAVIAGGVESMSRAEHYTTELRFGDHRGALVLQDRLDRARVTAGSESVHPVPGGMLETAENLRRRFGIGREEQDQLALRSHRLAISAWEEGRFQDHVVPVTPTLEGEGPALLERDERPRPDTSLERLSSLRPVRQSVDPKSTVTAGNSSGENDAAAVCVVSTPEAAERLGLEPVVELCGWRAAGVAPAEMGLGPVPATERLLRSLGMPLEAMGLIELNEAFAAQVIAVERQWRLSDSQLERVNVNGGAIALGHPIGATGARILADLAAEMRRRQVELALETMCIGGGQGLSAVFKLV